jgi:hypothetical protein
MRWMLLPLLLAAFLLPGSPARSQALVGVVGNDTGGIIPWSPFTQRFARAIASAHCARYVKYARITSVHRQYGDYIGFVCRFGVHGPAVLVRLG